MSYVRADYTVGDEPCDKCGKPIDIANPGIMFKALTQEHERVSIWAHMGCIEKLIAKTRKDLAESLKERAA